MRSSKLSRNSRRTIAASSAAIMLFSSTAVSVAGADELDVLIAEMESVSQAASAKNEEVKALSADLEDSEAELGELESQAADADAKASEARDMQREYQAEVDRLADAQYRGVVVDPLTNALAAEDPQDMVDRTSYLGVLSRNASEDLVSLEDATRDAADSADQANIAVAEADFQRSQLETQHQRLEQERAELEEQVAAVEKQVDELDEQAQERWINKNDPEPPAIAAGSSGGDVSASADGAVGAALSKLGAPYGWGATGPDAFDCSGLTSWAHQQAGTSIPRTSQAQIAGGTSVSRDELQPGDIVGFYPGVTHVGLYIGNGQVVHAADYGIPVQVVSVDSMPWSGASRY